MPTDADPAIEATSHKADFPCHISVPWSLPYYLSVRGAENFHIVLWIAKDLSWTQDNYNCSWTFGMFALIWCCVLLYNAVSVKAWEELYNLVAVIMWLVANFIWMIDEVEYHNDDLSQPTVEAVAIIMGTAIGWIMMYHLVLKPMKVFPEHDAANRRFESAGLKCRFSYFKSWRQYEHLHTLCWLGKDLSWNRLNPYTWVICVIPTVLIAVDFIWTTFRTNYLMVDTVHYTAQLMWVLGNGLWAIGNIYITENDDDRAFFIFDTEIHSREELRWWASWMLFAAYIPLLFLYCVWIPLTLMGKIDPATNRESTEGFHSENDKCVQFSGGFSGSDGRDGQRSASQQDRDTEHLSMINMAQMDNPIHA